MVRDSLGHVLGTMAYKMKGSFDPYLAECLAIQQRLVFVAECGLYVDQVESDSLNVVCVIKRNKAAHSLAQFAFSCNSLMYRLEESSSCISHNIASEKLISD